MAQELIKVQTRKTDALVSGDTIIFTPAVGEIVHLLFVLVHQLLAGEGFDIKGGAAATLWKGRNGDSESGVPAVQTRDIPLLAINGTFNFDAAIWLKTDIQRDTGGLSIMPIAAGNQFKDSQIKFPVRDDVTNANPLIFRSSTGSHSMITSVWVVKE